VDYSHTIIPTNYSCVCSSFTTVDYSHTIIPTNYLCVRSSSQQWTIHIQLFSQEQSCTDNPF